MPSRRLAAAATALVATVATPLALAAPATAGAPASALVYLSDADNHSGMFGIVAAPSTDPTHAHPVLATGSMNDVLAAKVAPDGQHVAALVDPHAGSATDDGNYQLQVMNLDGSGRHTLASEATTDTGITALQGFSWADNANLVFGYFHSEFDLSTFTQTTTRDLQEVAAAGGTPTTLPGSDGLGDPAVAPDGTTIAATYLDPDAPRGEVSLRTYDATTGTLGGTSIDVGYLGLPVWSHDGTRLAYVKDTSTNASIRSEVDAVTLAAGTWSAPVAIVPTSGSLFDQNPSWTPDDATVWFDRVDTSSRTPQESIWTVAPDGTGLQQAISDPAGDVAMPTMGAVDATAPGAPTLTPFGLNGTTTTVRWAPAADTDYLYAVITRDRGTADETAFTASGTSYADTTTVVGHTYSYDVTAVDAAGNHSVPSAARQVTALAPPRITVASPTSATQTGLAFTVGYGPATNPAGTAYAVQQRVVGGSTSAPVTTTSPTAKVTGVAGRGYQFRAQVVDAFGNASGYTGWSTATVPYDQTVGAFSRGWTTLHSSSYWLGSEAATSTNGATVSFTVTSRAVQLIGDRLPSGASFKVYVGSSYGGTISTVSTTTKHRQVLWSASLGSLAKRTIKLVAVVKTGHTLRIDGVAAPK